MIDIVAYLLVKNEQNEEGIRLFGRIDVEKDGNVYELKFVEELSYEHFLQT